MDINHSVDNSEYDILIVIDKIDIKVTRGRWIVDKQGLGNKGYLKIHVAVNSNIKEILALDVIYEKVYD